MENPGSDNIWTPPINLEYSLLNRTVDRKLLFICIIFLNKLLLIYVSCIYKLTFYILHYTYYTNIQYLQTVNIGYQVHFFDDQLLSTNQQTLQFDINI